MLNFEVVDYFEEHLVAVLAVDSMLVSVLLFEDFVVCSSPTSSLEYCDSDFESSMKVACCLFDMIEVDQELENLNFEQLVLVGLKLQYFAFELQM